MPSKISVRTLALIFRWIVVLRATYFLIAMANENKKNASVDAPKSNGGLLSVLNIAIENVEYKTRQQIANEIIAQGNGEIINFATLGQTVLTKDETVKYKGDDNEVIEYNRINVEMPAGALKLVRDEDNNSYRVQRARTSFVASASYSSKMHTDNATRILCELVAPNQFSMMSEKLNEEDYVIVLYHIL